MENSAKSTWDERVYDELRTLARRQMADESVGRTLQPTALLHEAWIRLANGGEPSPLEPVEFRARAATAMRRVRIDAARQRRALRRDVSRTIPIHDLTAAEALDERDDYVVALDAALTRLAREDIELARLVELKFFGCCEIEEIASQLGMSPRSVKRRWHLAKGWLHREITRDVDR